MNESEADMKPLRIGDVEVVNANSHVYLKGHC